MGEENDRLRFSLAFSVFVIVIVFVIVGKGEKVV